MVEVPGFLLLRGTDPADLPGIDPALATYVDFLTGFVPPDWTAIIVNPLGPAPGGFFMFTTDPVNRLVFETIDIRPFSPENVVVPSSHAPIPVALLGSESFDVTDVDVTTLAFGPDGAAPIFDLSHPFVFFLSHWDVNHDGKTDLLSKYRTQETEIALGDTEACLVGEMFDGTPFEGCDGISTVEGCGRGFELALLMPTLVLLSRRRAGS